MHQIVGKIKNIGVSPTVRDLPIKNRFSSLGHFSHLLDIVNVIVLRRSCMVVAVSSVGLDVIRYMHLLMVFSSLPTLSSFPGP